MEKNRFAAFTFKVFPDFNQNGLGKFTTAEVVKVWVAGQLAATVQLLVLPQ